MLLVPLFLATVRQMKPKGNASVLSLAFFLNVLLMSRLLTGEFGFPKDLNTKKFCVTGKRGKEVLLREKLTKGTAVT